MTTESTMGLLTHCSEGFKVVPLKAVNIKCSIFDRIANVTSCLTYLNDDAGSESNVSGDPFEAVFSLPMDSNCAIYHFEADINGRKIVGQCLDEDEARETYEVALTQEKAAFLFEGSFEANDIFTCSVGKLEPKATVIVSFKYVVELSLVPGEEAAGEPNSSTKYRFVLPTVLNPRYGSQETHTSIGSVPYEFSFECSVMGSTPFLGVCSSVDQFNISHNNPEKTRATISLESGNAPDHDLEMVLEFDEEFRPRVLYELADTTPIEGAEAGSSCGALFRTDVVMLTFMPKLLSQDSDDSKAVAEDRSEFIFVIDRSGSMGGHKIKHAKEALLLILKSLPVGCTFQIIGFGSSHSCLFDRPRVYNAESLKEAMEYQKKMDADLGATEILKPLTAIYGQHSERLRNIFILTDGEVGNTNEVIKLVEANADRNRVFSLGIGDGVSTALINGIAKSGKGGCQFVRNSNMLRAAVIDLMGLCLQPIVDDVTLTWQLPAGVRVHQIPKSLSPLFGGHLFVVLAILDGDLDQLDAEKGNKSHVTLSGKQGDRELTFELDINRSQGHSDPDFPLRRLAVKKELDEFSDMSREATVRLSKLANIASKYTSFVAVDFEGKEVGTKFIPQKDDDLLSCGLMMCGLEGGFSGGTFQSRGATRYMRKSRGFSLGLPKLPNLGKFFSKHKPSFSMGIRGLSRSKSKDFENKSKKEDKRSMSLRNKQVDMSASSNSNANTVTTIRLVQFQLFDGSWKLTEDLANCVLFSLDELKNAKLDWATDNQWATAIALSYLSNRCQDKQQEWTLLAQKANKWLKNCVKTTEKVTEILAAADLLVDPSFLP